MEKGIAWSTYLREFSPSDRAVVIAVQQHKAAICTMCSTAPWEWLDEDGQFDPTAFEAAMTSCPGCAVKDRARTAAQNGKTPEPAGSSWTLVPRRLAKAVQKASRPLSVRERARRAR